MSFILVGRWSGQKDGYQNGEVKQKRREQTERRDGEKSVSSQKIRKRGLVAFRRLL
jgi:hypothetical protein